MISPLPLDITYSQYIPVPYNGLIGEYSSGEEINLPTEAAHPRAGDRVGYVWDVVPGTRGQ